MDLPTDIVISRGVKKTSNVSISVVMQSSAIKACEAQVSNKILAGRKLTKKVPSKTARDTLGSW